MNVDELLSADRDLTDEELEFLEQELLKTLRQFNDQVRQLSAEVEEEDPELAAKLRQSAQSALDNAEIAASIPFSPQNPLNAIGPSDN